MNNNKALGRLLQQIGGAIQSPTKPRPPRNFVSRPAIQHHHPVRLPHWWTTGLAIVCNDKRHLAPLPTRFAGWGKSDSGSPLALFVCGGCGRTHAVAADRNGNPFTLFTKH